MCADRTGPTAPWWRPIGWRHRKEDLASCRRLVVQLHSELAATTDRRSVLVATPTRSVVSAHTSILLACCAAEELRRPVLLVDICRRNPATTELLNYNGGPGVVDVLRDQPTRWNRVLQRTTCENLWFVATGGSGLAVDLAGSKTAALLRYVERRCALVVLSGGSVLDDSPALQVAPHVGSIILALVENETRMSELDAAQDALAVYDNAKLGVLMATEARVRPFAFNGDAGLR